jgi:two-component system response regulator YesN
MDGIALIREINRLGLKMQILVLSCHDEYEYVREALKLGANEYILKHVLTAESLLKLLQDMRSSIEIQTKQVQAETALQQYANKGRAQLKKELIDRINIEPLPFEKQFVLTTSHGLSGRYYSAAVIAVKLTNSVQLIDALAACGRMIEQKSGETVQYGDILYVFLDYSAIVSRSEQTRALLGLADDLAGILRDFDEMEPFFAASSVTMGDGSLYYALVQVRTALQNCFFGARFTYYPSMPPFGTDLPTEAHAVSRQFSEPSIGCARKLSMFYAAIEAIKAQRTHPDITRDWINCLDERTKKHQRLVSPATLDICMKRSEVYSAYWEELLSLPIPVTDHPGVLKAAEYIREHYHEAITLGQAAETAGLNPAYLSYLFKREAHINFSDYLLECRMEKMKQYLKDSDIAIKDAAYHCGFFDYQHFCKLFKSFTGLKPSDYRGQSRKQTPF